jgi:hypothetical protein
VGRRRGQEASVRAQVVVAAAQGRGQGRAQGGRHVGPRPNNVAIQSLGATLGLAAPPHRPRSSPRPPSPGIVVFVVLAVDEAAQCVRPVLF